MIITYSSINRINSFINADTGEDVEKILYMTSIHPDFKTLGLSARSQLRRVVKLYKEYQTR